MSSNSSSVDGLSPDTTQALLDFISASHPFAVLLLENTFFLALLVPTVLLLLYFSTPKSRQSGIWCMTVSISFVGLICGSYSTNLLFQILSVPFSIDVFSCSMQLVIMMCVLPWFIDTVLLFRLAVVYPPHAGQRRTFWAVLALPLAIKAARVVLLVQFIRSYAGSRPAENFLQGGAAELFAHLEDELARAEWALQLLENGYASAMFLWRLRVAFKGSDRGRVAPGVEWDAKDGFMRQVRTLFWIATGNFVTPLLINIVLLATPYQSLARMCTQVARVYVTLFGVVFATVWGLKSSKRRSVVAQNQGVAPAKADSFTNPVFASPSIYSNRDSIVPTISDADTKSGIEPEKADRILDEV